MVFRTFCTFFSVLECTLFRTLAHSFAPWCTLVAIWKHPTLQPPNIRELPPMTIITYIYGKYTVSYHMIDQVGAKADLQNSAVYTQTLLS